LLLLPEPYAKGANASGNAANTQHLVRIYSCKDILYYPQVRSAEPPRAIHAGWTVVGRAIRGRFVCWPHLPQVSLCENAHSVCGRALRALRRDHRAAADPHANGC